MVREGSYRVIECPSLDELCNALKGALQSQAQIPQISVQLQGGSEVSFEVVGLAKTERDACVAIQGIIRSDKGWSGEGWDKVRGWLNPSTKDGELNF